MVSLGVLQVANYLIPFLVLPIISRILGASLFGSVSYAQNIVSYLTLLVNFGFEYSATRQIAISRENKARTDAIFWAVIAAKSLLLLLSFAILAVLPLCMERVACDPRLYIYTALTNIGIVFFPTWYLQGEQQMDKMAWANFFTKLFEPITRLYSLPTHGMILRRVPVILRKSSFFMASRMISASPRAEMPWLM